MAEPKIEPLKPEKGPICDALNDDVAKGVLVDGLGVGWSESYVMLDGLIGPPRFKKDTVVSRILIPIDALHTFQDGINNAAKEIEAMRKKATKK